MLSAAGIPCGMVRDIGEAVSLPALEDRQLLLPLTVPGLPQRERVQILGAGYRSERSSDPQVAPPPRPDQDRSQILRWLEEG